MKFLSYDTIAQCERETEIRNANFDTINDFRLWDAYVDEKILWEKDKRFSYRIFEWDKLIHMSLALGFSYQCYAAYTGARLDGLLALRNQDMLYIDFFSTAPWNYYLTDGTMRRIGSGFIYFTITQSISLSLKGAFSLYAIQDAEGFCDRIGMIPTGRFKYGLKEYHMPEERASLFEKDFRRHVISIGGDTEHS